MAAIGNAEHASRSVADATHDLYRQYGKQIYAYCLHQLRSREEAEDAVQTTFLNAFRGLQRGTTTRFEQAWLYKIAQNVCIARRSSSGRRLRLEAPDDFEILQEVVPANGSTETLELMGLDAALEQMPENQRRAILLREWQGLSYREISDELGLSQGAVEMLIFRARRTLATALEQPDVAARRKTGKAKTGFSFGSLVAALKSLFSTGATLKMAAVAMTAAVVGTHAVGSVVQNVVTHHAPKPVPPVVRPAGTTAASVPSAAAVLPTKHFESWANRPVHAAANVVTPQTAPAPAVETRPVIAPDVDVSSGRPLATQTAAAPTGSQQQTPQSAPGRAAASSGGSTSGAARAGGGPTTVGAASPSDTSMVSGNQAAAGSVGTSGSGSSSDLTATGTTARHDTRGGAFGTSTTSTSSAGDDGSGSTGTSSTGTSTTDTSTTDTTTTSSSTTSTSTTTTTTTTTTTSSADSSAGGSSSSDPSSSGTTDSTDASSTDATATAASTTGAAGGGGGHRHHHHG
jgi:RNA polymerase sigma factor (sigma-70 family)